MLLSKSITSISQRTLYLTIAVVLGIFWLIPVQAHAAGITGRKVTLSTSSPASSAATTTYTFNFTVPTTGTIVKSFSADVCTSTAFSSCIPSGFSVSSSTLTQPTNIGDASGWTVNTSTAGSLRMTKTTDATTPTGSQTVVFNNVQNPTTANATFYIKLTTYSDAAWATPIDTGIVAASTSQAIALSGTVDESLVFCTGASGANCSAMTSAGGAVSFSSTFSSSATRTATSTMLAGTNGGSGYTVTVNGGTMTCAGCPGTPSIAAMGTQTANGSATASSIGTAQFGMNLVANTTPSVGSNKSGGSGAYGTNYGTADTFRFLTADSVATAAGASDNTLYTVSYIVNIPSSQAAGTYTATMTYICTATF